MKLEPVYRIETVASLFSIADNYTPTPLDEWRSSEPHLDNYLWKIAEQYGEEQGINSLTIFEADIVPVEIIGDAVRYEIRPIKYRVSGGYFQVDKAGNAIKYKNDE
jgi:hypothetical protein